MAMAFVRVSSFVSKYLLSLRPTFWHLRRELPSSDFESHLLVPIPIDLFSALFPPISFERGTFWPPVHPPLWLEITPCSISRWQTLVMSDREHFTDPLTLPPTPLRFFYPPPQHYHQLVKEIFDFKLLHTPSYPMAADDSRLRSPPLGTFRTCPQK